LLASTRFASSAGLCHELGERFLQGGLLGQQSLDGRVGERHLRHLDPHGRVLAGERRRILAGGGRIDTLSGLIALHRRKHRLEPRDRAALLRGRPRRIGRGQTVFRRQHRRRDVLLFELPQTGQGHRPRLAPPGAHVGKRSLQGREQRLHVPLLVDRREDRLLPPTVGKRGE